MVENKEKITRPEPWAKEMVTAIKCNPEALSRLAQVDLSAVCGHNTSFVVSRV
jgi:hypothetical protein